MQLRKSYLRQRVLSTYYQTMHSRTALTRKRDRKPRAQCRNKKEKCGIIWCPDEWITSRAVAVTFIRKSNVEKARDLMIRNDEKCVVSSGVSECIIYIYNYNILLCSNLYKTNQVTRSQSWERWYANDEKCVVSSGVGECLIYIYNLL